MSDVFLPIVPNRVGLKLGFEEFFQVPYHQPNIHLNPRLSLLRDADYTLDYENALDATCTNPWQVLNTRIDWIAIKSFSDDALISNIPVLGVGLNSLQTNISDHKPIAAQITWQK